jgi:hypothetical protein
MSKGYHITKINKGVLGEWSKIKEEWEEFEDAKAQGSKIMMMVELSDVYGAVQAFYEKYHINGDATIASGQELEKVNEEAKKLGIAITDIIIFSNATKRAFRNGER